MNRFVNRPVALLSIIAAVLWLVSGCNTATDPDSNAIMETNLFPFAQGRMFVYSHYLLDTTTTQKIQNSVYRDVWHVQGITTVSGKSAFRIIDSIYTPSGAFDTNDTLYFAVENGDLLVITPEFNNTWVTVFKSSAGTNSEYTAGQYVSPEAGGIVTVKVTINPKEAVSTTIGTVQAYKVQMKSSATVSGVTIEQLIYLYLADSYGLVKFNMPVRVDPFTGKKQFGEEFLMESKNF